MLKKQVYSLSNRSFGRYRCGTGSDSFGFVTLSSDA